MITVYVVAYNEEVLVPFMIDHYRSRFPNCRIIVFDNYSSDKTVELTLKNGAEVKMFDTGGKFSDTANVNIKNKEWKSANTDWILTCDMDELLDINEQELRQEEALGSTLIRSEGYGMVNMEDDKIDLPNITFGARCTPYDKPYLFNKKYIKEINYMHGCHNCNPVGKVQFSSKAYKAYHYKCIGEQYLVDRVKSYGSRMSQENLSKGWGRHYLLPEQVIRNDFRSSRIGVIKVK